MKEQKSKHSPHFEYHSNAAETTCSFSHSSNVFYNFFASPKSRRFLTILLFLVIAGLFYQCKKSGDSGSEVVTENDNNSSVGADAGTGDTFKTVIDSNTGLMWQLLPEVKDHANDTRKNWEDAKKHCDGLTFAGDNWRLPTQVELEGIKKYTVDPPPDGDIFFPHTDRKGYWSSIDTVSGAQRSAWVMTYDTVNLSGFSRIYHTWNVRCVRKHS